MNYTQCDTMMKKHLDYLHTEYARMQLGRASKGLVDYLFVHTPYGEQQMGSVANITIQDASTIKIEPRDKSLVKHISDAIYKAENGLSPRAGDTTVLVSLPPVTGERRKELVKQAYATAEECKARMRNSRQDAMNAIKKGFADKILSEDQKKAEEKAIDELTKTYTQKVDASAKAKETEIMG